MRLQSSLRRMPVLACTALVLASFAVSPVYSHKAPTQDGYKFKVRNKSNMVILALLTSEKGKKWKKFDIGTGIAPGKTMELVWDQSTEGTACEWWIKAVYDDGNLSEAGKFDFCEKDLLIDF